MCIRARNIRSGEPVGTPRLVNLGVIGFGFAPAGSPVKDAGYFVLNVSKNKVPVSTVALKDGETETVVDLPLGDYELEVVFMAVDGKRLLKDELAISVVRKQRETVGNSRSKAPK